MIHIYTGDGKGKTTAALGLTLRAAGHGMRVKIIQFMKGWSGYGEIEALKKVDSVSIEQYGRKEMVKRGSPTMEDITMAKSGLAAAAEAVRGSICDMLILDELNVAVDYKLIELQEVLELLRACPKKIEIILTGRNAPKELVEIADYVTEMVEIKHPYSKGTKERKGIEY